MTEASKDATAGPAGFDAFGFLARFAPLIFLIVLMAVFAILEPRFLNPLNLFNVMRQVSIYGLLAIGMTFVILTAGIDLSVGSLIAFAGLAAALVAKGGLESRFAVGAAQEAAGFGWGLAALAAIIVGMACGALQGLAITKLKVPPFVVTLGGMSAFRGAALLLSGGGPISGFSESYRWWGPGQDLGHGADPGGDLPAVRRAGPHRAALIPATAEGSTRSAATRRRRGCPASTWPRSSAAST